MDKKYMIIDSHSHIFPEKIATKASDAIGDFYNLPMRENGSIGGLLRSGGKIGVSKYIVHSTATSVHQVRSINNFIIDAVNTYPELIGYMTLHPDMQEKEVRLELQRCMAAGLKGIKLHPDFQKFYIDEEKAHNIYRCAEGVLPILFHVGDDRYDYSHPYRLTNIALAYPQLRCIAAHMGGYTMWELAECYKGLDNVYFDTCSSLFALTPEKAVSIINMLGVDRFFFACDYPMWDHEEELERFLKLNLSEEQREKILSANIQKFLNI
ncbi:MAG: hypothetical protein EOM87_01770 [Clostridia bacterium]|nr:hypothetical protein [Clostridia bacterium]